MTEPQATPPSAAPTPSAEGGKPMHAIEFRVRYCETDQMGVVYHPNYLTYFEMGRIEMLRRGGLAYRDVEAAGILLVVAKAEVRYKAPARYDDELLLETTLERITSARIDHGYKLWRKSPGPKTLLAEGNTTLACVNRAGELQAIPESIRNLRG
jgi:acyl-CoA thioester hydrolase